jgi:hypothetical protein
MVDVKLDLTPGSLEPASNHDCFVSVRVGELQKLSRLANSRTYRFPKISENHQGKIEVFKRVAFYPLDINPLNDGPAEVTLPIGTSGKVGFQVDISASEATKEKTRQAQKEQGNDITASKTNNAKEYLQKHCVEQKLSEAMQALLRERPDNPAEFLANALRNLNDSMPSPVDASKRIGGPAATTGDKCEPAPPNTMQALRKEAELALVKASQDGRLQLALSETKGKCAYPAMPAEAWSRIYSKFPTVAKLVPQATAKPSVSALVPFKPYYTTNVCAGAGLDRIYAKFPAQPRPKAPAVEEPQKAWLQKPSVGTWLAGTPFNASVASAAEDKRELGSAGPKKKWAMMPSTGTWVQPLFGNKQSAAKCTPPTSGKMVVSNHQLLGAGFIGTGLRFI